MLDAVALELVYETHSMSVDNERGIATGWLPGELSERGRKLAWALGERRRHGGIACVFTSDVRRAVETAEIAFEGSGIEIRQDGRLRECNYGAILSRWPITRESTRVLPTGARDAGRTALFALIARPAGAVPFFTTQLTSAVALSALRSDQVRALVQFVLDEIPEDAIPLVTGDFNAEPDSDEIRLLGHKTPPPLPGLVLLDAWRYADPATPGWTWDRLNPAVLARANPTRVSTTYSSAAS